MSATRLPTEEIVETLQIFLARERELYVRIPENWDPKLALDTKITMLHGMACLAAAAARLMPIPDQASPQEPGTSQD